MRTMPGLFLLLAAVGCGTGPAAGPTASSTPADRPAVHENMPDMPDMPAHAAKPGNPDKPAKVPAANQVVIDNFAYTPRTITVAAGTEVTWVNHDDVAAHRDEHGQTEGVRLRHAGHRRQPSPSSSRRRALTSTSAPSTPT